MKTKDKFTFRFIDLYNQIGVAYTLSDGTRKAIRLQVPENYVKELQDVAHERV